VRINKSLITYIPSSGSGSGTVTSVAMTVPTGLVVTGSPITASGTLAVTFASGYSIPTTASQGLWNDAYAFTSGFPVGTEGQLLRYDEFGSLEVFTADYMSNPMTSLGDIIYGNAAGFPIRRSPNITTTKKFLSQVGDGTTSAAPQWSEITSTDTGSVPTTRELTINNVVYDLSANREWSVGDYGTW
jgi:hypothetical protein